MLGGFTNSSEQVVAVLKLCAVRKGESDIFLGRADDGYNALYAVGGDSIADDFLSIGSAFFHQVTDHCYDRLKFG